MLAACGSGGGGDASSGSGNDKPGTPAEAARFLTQATFGPTTTDVARVQEVGYSAWVLEQQTLPPSLHRPAIAARAGVGSPQPEHRQATWWKHALTAPDQLRQRVAFALSEILVISDQNDSIGADVLGCAEFYDHLVRNAFGNYRELLEHVTLSPQMGKYLSHWRNAKPDPINNTRPDENYAREIMQLFTIGLFELNADGTRKTDSSGNPIPTYDQDDIIGLAHVFTGWNYAGARSWYDYSSNWLPMEAWNDFHDMEPKAVLGTTFAAGRTARQDLEQALDLLANHANVGPFLGRQLIQRLVTSNPSPAYVARVARVWADDGKGERGNLAAVVSAILLDDEAQKGTQTNAAFGKVREPLLMQTALWRAFAATSPAGTYDFAHPEFSLGQAAMRARTVFNFFRPDYTPQGELVAARLSAPEFQVLDHASSITIVNQLYSSIFERVLGAQNAPATEILIDLAPALAAAGSVADLVALVDLRLLSGTMSAALREALLTHLASVDDDTTRAQDAIYLVATSPDFFVQK
ncbi:MAG: DUF1800 domain-containing protein [Planctomycetes bacterium]|nr:DUF1800 domain-containing protein [Planctomycetota bacterium]